MVGSERHVLLAACEDVQTASMLLGRGSYRGVPHLVSGRATESNGNITPHDLHGLSAKALKAGGYSQNPQLAWQNDAARVALSEFPGLIPMLHTRLRPSAFDDLSSPRPKRRLRIRCGSIWKRRARPSTTIGAGGDGP